MYQLSILIPSKYPDKLAKLVANLRNTMARFNETEIVICQDGDDATHYGQNFVWCYSPPSKYRSTFHEKPALEASGRFLMMANDDIEFKTQNWDLMIPYDRFDDDLTLFYFKDNFFNQNFACHPVFSRRILEIEPDILSPKYQITKCDNTIWDIHPASRRIYLPEIELIHHHEELGNEWRQAYMEDDQEYARTQERRNSTRATICKLIGMDQKVLIGIPTGREVRRPEFYDHFNMIQRPPGTLCEFVHGPSIANNRNILIKSAITNSCSHIFMLDDDTVCNPDIVFQLLKHDKDIVTALQVGKSFPHRPYLFDMILENHTFRYYKLNSVDKGLIPIKGAGFGAILIKTDVFIRLEEPWIRFNPHLPDQLGEDLYFFEQLHNFGIKAYCDLDCITTHYAHVGIRVVKTDKGWNVVYDTAGEGMVNYLHTEQEHLMVEEAR